MQLAGGGRYGMARDHMTMAVLSAAARRALVVLLAIACLAAACCALVLLVRHFQEMRGEGAVASPLMPPAAHASEATGSGSFTADITYTSLDAPHGGEVASSVTWDDAWFTADPTAYNHELATTSSVLAALAYSESGYYQAASTQPAYMEEALAALGFQDVSTASYRYRSEVVDEVLNLFTNDADTVAYTIARKRLVPPAADGRPRDLILVSVRGSYGSEWLSNLHLAPEASGAHGGERASSKTSSSSEMARDELATIAEPFASALEGWMSFVGELAGFDRVPASEPSSASEPAVQPDDDEDHRGYVRAAREICAELGSWIEKSHASGAEVSVLLTGHSRGGAIANLVASEIDDAMADGVAGGAAETQAASSLAGVDAAYAYTFAAPATTTSAQAHDARYANIFNIVNPSDIMPYLPLRSWGYERYGVNLYLPAAGADGFDERYGRMRRAYAQTVGAESSYDPADKQTVDLLVDEVSERIASTRDLMTPAGAAAVAASCMTHIDPVRILYGHYPSTYIAWMDVLGADDLARG